MQFCSSHRIPLHVLPSSTDFKLSGFELPSPSNWPSAAAPSASKQWDLGIVASFGYLVPRGIIESFGDGMVNVHPSLLPQYVGSAPIPFALLNGDRITGVSIIDVVPKLDGGPILAQNTLSIDDEETFRSLSAKLADLGGRSLCGVLSDLKRSRLRSVPQNEHEPQIKALYEAQRGGSKQSEFELIKTRKIQKGMSFIDWRLPAQRIVNRHRAIDGLLRNSRTVLGTKADTEKLLVLVDEVAVHRIHGNDPITHSLCAEDEHHGVGSIAYCKHRDVLFVKCGRNEDGTPSLLAVRKLRIAPSLSSQHLATFDRFIEEFGHFLPFHDEQEYRTRIAPNLKNHF